MRPEDTTPAATRALEEALFPLITGRGAGAIGQRAEALDMLIVGDARASAAERLAVYAHMYRARIVEALESQFPRLAAHLGADAFADLAAAYIADEPSRHPSLRFVGERLPAWLTTRHPDNPALGGLAALEWARADVFDLADEATLTLETLRVWPADRFAELPLRLVTAHRLVRVPSGTAALWDALGGQDQAQTGSLPPPCEVSEALLVWREGAVVYHRQVDWAESIALEEATGGTQLGTMCETLLGAVGEHEATARAFAWISTWVTDGLVRDPF